MKKIITLMGFLAIAPFINAQDGKTVPASNVKPKAAATVPAKTSTPAGWTDDLEAAKKQAAQEGKSILVDFSGSDWCGWCVRLDEEVFSTKEFKDGVKDKFVLVFIDSPRDQSKLSENAKKNNPKLVEKYGIRGFPSVLLLTEDGTQFAQTGYQQGGPKAYLKHLNELVASGKIMIDLRKELKTLAAGTVERAKKIDSVLSKLSVEEQLKNEELVQEVLKIDADGKLGLLKNYPYFTEYRPVEVRMKAYMNNVNSEIMSGVRALPAELQKDQKAMLAKAAEILNSHRADFEKFKAEADELAKNAKNETLRSAFSDMRDELAQMIKFAEDNTTK